MGKEATALYAEADGAAERPEITWEFGASEELAGGRVPGTAMPPIRGSAVFRSFCGMSHNTHE